MSDVLATVPYFFLDIRYLIGYIPNRVNLRAAAGNCRFFVVRALF